MWNTTGDRSGRPRYESLSRFGWCIWTHTDISWSILILSSFHRCKILMFIYGFSHVLYEALGHSSAWYHGQISLASVIALHSMLLQWLANALRGCCNLKWSSKLVMEIPERKFGNTKTSKIWETRKLTLYLHCYNMSQEKLLLAEHFATQLGNSCTSTSAIWSAVIEDRPCHSAIGHQSHHCPYTKLISLILNKMWGGSM